MTVYLVWDAVGRLEREWYGNPDFYSVFSTRDKAEAFIARHRGAKGGNGTRRG
jgi:hypothetical protein